MIETYSPVEVATTLRVTPELQAEMLWRLARMDEHRDAWDYVDEHAPEGWRLQPMISECEECHGTGRETWLALRRE